MACNCGGRRRSLIGRETTVNGATKTSSIRRPGEILPGSVWNGPKAKQQAVEDLKQ